MTASTSSCCTSPTTIGLACVCSLAYFSSSKSAKLIFTRKSSCSSSRSCRSASFLAFDRLSFYWRSLMRSSSNSIFCRLDKNLMLPFLRSSCAVSCSKLSKKPPTLGIISCCCYCWVGSCEEGGGRYPFLKISCSGLSVESRKSIHCLSGVWRRMCAASRLYWLACSSDW